MFPPPPPTIANNRSVSGFSSVAAVASRTINIPIADDTGFPSTHSPLGPVSFFFLRTRFCIVFSYFWRRPYG